MQVIILKETTQSSIDFSIDFLSDWQRIEFNVVSLEIVDNNELLYYYTVTIYLISTLLSPRDSQSHPPSALPSRS